MRLSIAVSIAVIGSFIELAGFLIIYIFLGKQNIKDEIFKFDFGESPFDLLVISILRYGILIGAVIGQLRNKFNGTKRIKNSKKLVIYFACFIIIYSVLKTLYFIEDTDTDFRRWFLFTLTYMSCISLNIYWKVLASSKFNSQVQKKLLINSSNGESDSISKSSKNSDSSSSEDSDEDSDSDDEDDEDKKLNPLDKAEASKISTSRTVWKLLKLTKDDTLYLFLALLALIACSGAQVFLPYYTGLVVDYIVIEKSIEKFRNAMLYMALITVASGLASGLRAGLFCFVHARYMLRLQNLLYSRIMKMEVGFFDVRKTGEITSRLTSDCTKVGDSIGLNVNVFLRNIIKIIGILFFMFKISWKLSIVTLVSIPVIAIISEAFGEKYRILSEKVQTALAKANESAEESISNIRTVRSFAAEYHEIKRYADLLKVPYKYFKQESIISCFYRWCTEITDLTMTLLVLFYGGHLVIRNDLKGGELISFILYSIELGFSFEEIGDVYTGLMEAVGASKNILVYIERNPMVDWKGGLDTGNFNGNVQFKNVSFAYPARSEIQVLNDISFEAKRGEIVALVGPSGGGKSSIVNLLEHFYEATKGSILIDNIPLNDYEHHYIHEKMSLVQQEPVLFARSITENIAYGLRYEVSHVDVKNAAIMASAQTFIEAMPKAYDEETGEKGIQLSGGQKQRVAIARALIRNPSILILDEATSALDSESEYLVQQAINKNLTGRTVIVIAHRLSTIEKADKILVIDKGKIIQVGNHTELLSNPDGIYANLVKRQLLGVDPIDPKDQNVEAVDIPKSNRGKSISPKSSLSKSNIKL